MSASLLAFYLRRIRLSRRVPRLHELAREIELQFPSDEATSRLLAVLATKIQRLARAN